MLKESDTPKLSHEGPLEARHARSGIRPPYILTGSHTCNARRELITKMLNLCNTECNDDYDRAVPVNEGTELDKRLKILRMRRIADLGRVADACMASCRKSAKDLRASPDNAGC